MSFLQLNGFYYLLPIPISASDNKRVFLLLHVVYFVNVIHDMDLHFRTWPSWLPLKEGDWGGQHKGHPLLLPTARDPCGHPARCVLQVNPETVPCSSFLQNW